MTAVPCSWAKKTGLQLERVVEAFFCFFCFLCHTPRCFLSRRLFVRLLSQTQCTCRYLRAYIPFLCRNRTTVGIDTQNGPNILRPSDTRVFSFWKGGKGGAAFVFFPSRCGSHARRIRVPAAGAARHPRRRMRPEIRRRVSIDGAVLFSVTLTLCVFFFLPTRTKRERSLRLYRSGSFDIRGEIALPTMVARLAEVFFF